MPDKRGWIYIVSGAGLYKIGRTSTPRGAAGRLSSLQGASPAPLKLEMSFEVEFCYVTERRLHEHFRHKAAKNVGREWFALNSDDLEWLRTLDVVVWLRERVPNSEPLATKLRRLKRRECPVVRLALKKKVNDFWASLDPAIRVGVSKKLAEWGRKGTRGETGLNKSGSPKKEIEMTEPADQPQDKELICCDCGGSFGGMRNRPRNREY